MDGIDLIKKYEGFRAKAYKDPIGKMTIGFGSTTWEDGKPVKRGDTITEDKAEALLINYLNKYIRPKLEPLKLKQNQVSALESLCYNIGWNAFAKSKCYKALIAKDWATFIKEYDWFKAGGKLFLGLVKRRTEELYTFFKE